MTQVKIYGSSALIQPANIGGSPDAVLKDWFDWAADQDDNSVKTKDGVTTLTVSDSDALEVDTVMYAISKGYEVEGLPLMIELTAAKYAANVLEGIPNRTIEDEEGNETILKWSEWKRANNEHFQIGDKYYIMTNANVSPNYLKGSEFAVIYGKAGYNLLTNKEFKALQPEVEQ
jgi:hypothetical protein